MKTISSKIVALALVGLLCVSVQSQAQDKNPSVMSGSVMSGSGTGAVSVEPDEGYITVGVVSKADSSSQAVRDNTEVMQGLFATLKKLGVERKDIKTVQFSVQQQQRPVKYRNEEGELQTKYVPDGFVVSNIVRVTVCELDSFGKVLDAVTQSGANRVQSISFGSSEEAKHRDAARVLAVKDCVRRANMLTDVLGIKLGKIKFISESQPRQQREAYGEMRLAAASNDVPVSGGSLTFSANVIVTWELVQ